MAKPETGVIVMSAGEERGFSIGKANYLKSYDQSGLVEVELWSNNRIVESHIVERFDVLADKAFDRFVVKNISGASNTLRFFHGVGRIVGNADRSEVTVDSTTPVDVDLVGGSVTLNQSNISNGATSVPDVSCGAAATTQVVVGSASNVQVRVTNPIGSGEVLRVGAHAAVGAANGTPLQEGDTWEVLTQSDVYVYNPGAGAVAVPVEVETRI